MLPLSKTAIWLQNLHDESRGEMYTAVLSPCSSAMLLRLKDFFTITIFYYNPNIAPKAEYEKRAGELQKLIGYYKHDLGLDCGLIIAPYRHEEFLEVAKGLEGEAEGGHAAKSATNYA